MTAAQRLFQLLESSGAKILFGLEAQGHIPKVEFMLARGATWAEIGREIGWDGATAEQFYGMYLKRAGSGVGTQEGA